MADLSTQIEAAAVEPAKAVVDGMAVEARLIDELIAADRYLAAKSAKAKRHQGLLFQTLVPPGA